MSGKVRNRKPARKSHTGHTGGRQLERFLRALARGQTCLVHNRDEDGSSHGYTVCSTGGEGDGPVFRPEEQLVEDCLSQDLLEKTQSGWVLGTNGRLALKRLVAGTDAFAAQHQERHIRQRKLPDGAKKVLVNDRSSPLGWLLQRTDADGKPMITNTQFAAGERLAQDFQYAGMMPRTTSSWGGQAGPGHGGQRRSAPGAGIEMTDNRLAARQRVRNAITEVGSDLADILLDICCFQVGLSKAEKARNWPRRSGKVILQIALDRLADHYGMSAKKTPASTNSRISHWGSEDYKPS